MRVRLELADPRLRDALAALLEHAGHEVTVGAGDEAPVDLTVCHEPPEPGTGPRGAVLALRPGAGRESSPDPEEALRSALARGGEAVWQAPLDPARLLDLLARPGAPVDGAGPPPSVPGAEAFALAANAWFLLDLSSQRLLPLSAPAGAALRAPAPAAPGARTPGPDVLAAVRAQEHGCRIVGELFGRGGLAVWWSPAPRRRLLAWIPWEGVEHAEDLATLKALADLGRISSTFAHEVRNPLASFASALDLLRRPMSELERQDVLDLAAGRVAHLRTLLDDTLRLVRSFRGAPQPVDLGEVIASARGLALADPAFRDVAIEVEGPEVLPRPLSYVEPLRQALTNLLLNAAQAQGSRGTLRIVVARREGRVVLAVVDQGPGIPAEHRARVFDPFWTTKLHGTGLGLSFVRRLAEASGGTARVADTPPPGARVEIELPESP